MQDLYKTLQTSRGFIYRYYCSLPQSNERASLLLIHGFPFASYSWDRQVPFFEANHFKLIIPDLLGYGGSSKPRDTQHYRLSLICKDLIEILDFEKAECLIAIGHDSAGKVIGRLANYYPDRFLGFAFFALGYRPPKLGQELSYDRMSAIAAKVHGYEVSGYWAFFSEDESDRIIEDHIDSFLRLILTKDPDVWRIHAGKTGAFKTFLLADRKAETRASEEEIKVHKSKILKYGIAGGLQYYRIIVNGVDHMDSQDIPEANIYIRKPVFFGGAKLALTVLPQHQMSAMVKTCQDLTYVGFNCHSFIKTELPDDFNREILKWINASVLTKNTVRSNL